MSLRVWLPLNGDLHDQGLSNITVTNNGATIDNSGKIGKCYEFDGTDDYLSLDNLTCSGWSEFSVTCWVYPTAAFNYLFLIRGGGAHRVRISGDGFMFRDSNNSSQRIIGFGTTISQNVWSHIACIYNRGEIFIYINGILTAHNTNYYHSDSVLLSDQNEIRIARQQSSSGNSYYTGKINDFRIYDHALSELEIKEIARAKVLHYPLNHNGMGQSNLISNSVYNSDPWLSAIKAKEEYGGKLAYRISCSTLYTKTSNGANDIFNNTITYKENTQYTLSIDWRDDYRADNKNSSWYLRFFYTDGSTVTQIISPSSTKTEWTHSKMTSNANKTIAAIRTTYGNSGQLYFINLKLEEGTQDTGYALPYDESNNIEYDISGYCNNGTKVGTFTYSTDTPKYNSSTYFNGSSLIEAEPLPSETLTISTWVKFADTSGSSYRMVVHDKNTGLAIGYYSSKIITYVGSSSGGIGSCVTANLSSNTWYHIVVVKTGSTTRDTYINGVKATPTTNNWWGGDMNKLHIGGRHISGAYAGYTTGKIVDVRAYATALSEQDVLDLYNNSTLNVSS